MHNYNRFAARLRKSMGQKNLLSKETAYEPSAGGLLVPKGTPETPKPDAAPPAEGFGKKVKAAFTPTNIAAKQKKFEGGVLGALGSAAQEVGRTTRGFVRAKAGAPTLEGDSKDPGEDLSTGPSAEDQDIFGQQSGRKQSQQTKRGQRQLSRQYQSGAAQTGARSPQNVQNRPPVRQMKSFNPALASLLAVSAGFAASDAVVNASGARGARSITDDQLNLFNVMANKRRGKKLRKEHSPLPPIQGLVWDEGAKRWRKPENVGKTASEVQGKKRIRGSALGQTAKTPGGTAAGKGRGRAYSRGRAQRVAAGDIGVAGTDASKLSSKRRRKKRG